MHQSTALDIARHVARGLGSPPSAGDHMLAYFKSGVYGDRDVFRPLRLSTGLTGVLLLLLVLESLDEAAPDVTDRYVEALCGLAGGSPTLFGGWAGVYVVLRMADHSGRLRSRLPLVRDRLRAALGGVPRMPSGEPYRELLGGLAGIALVDDPLVPETCAIRAGLQEWSQRPGAWAGSENSYFLGVAHGIAGFVPALLAGGAPNFDIVRKLCYDLMERRTSVGAIPAWPRSTAAVVPPHLNCSWCHGTAGIAAVLFKAGSTLGDARIAAFGRDTMVALAEAGVERLPVDTDCVCHGWAGIMLCALSIGDPRLEAFVDAIFVRLTQRFDRLLPFGFREGAYGGLVSVAFLDGAVGIALALLAFAFPQSRTWTMLLGIAAPPPLA